MIRRWRLSCAAIALLVPLALFTGCGDDGGGDAPPPPPPTPLLLADPTSLDLGTSFTSTTFDIRNIGGGLLTWSLSTSRSWLSVNPASGSTLDETDAITVTVDRTQLTPGQSYSGTVTVSSDGGNATVTIQVEQGVNPVLSVLPTTLDFGTSSTSLTFDIENAGSGTLTWSLSDDQTWITLSTTTGTTTTETDTVTVTINRGGFSPGGSYSGTVTVTSDGGTQQVTVQAQEEAITGAVYGYCYYAGTTIPVSGVLVEIDLTSYTTGSDGYYLLSSVTAGSQTITASKLDYDPFSQSISVPEAGLSFDIDVTSGFYTHVLDGTLTNALGNTISAATVTVLNPDDSPSGLTDTTDATGHYSIPTVPQGTRTVRFETTYYDSTDEPLFMASADKTYNVQMVASPIDPPANLQITEGVGQIDLSWDAVAGPPVSGYYVYRSTEAAAGYARISGLLTEATYADTNVGPFEEFYYRVAAVNVDDIEGDQCSEVSGMSGVILLIASSSSGYGVKEIRTTDAAILWEYPGGRYFAQRLSNGNTLTRNDSGVVEVTPANNVVWSSLRSAVDAKRLSNGNTLLTIDGSGVLEIDSSDNVVWEWGVTIDDQLSEADRLPSGNTLICWRNNYTTRRVTEIDNDLNVVWEKILNEWPVAVDRLANGNTLVVGWGGTIREYGTDGSTVWSYEYEFVRSHCAAKRLPNGMTVVACDERVYVVDPSGAQVFELSLSTFVVGGTPARGSIQILAQ